MFCSERENIKNNPGKVAWGGEAGRQILMKDEVWKYVKECSEVRPRLVWMRMSQENEKWVFVSGYVLDKGSLSVEEREAFWFLLRNFK